MSFSTFAYPWSRCIVLAMMLLSSCAGVRQQSQSLRVEAGYCDPPNLVADDPAFLPLPDIRPQLRDSLLPKRFSRRSLLLANAAGVLPQLHELVRLERATPTGNARSEQYQAQQQRILTRLLLLSTTIASVAAELDCEGERADQVASYLTEHADKREQRLTVLSIAIGAASGIATTVLEGRTGQYTFGIGGGIATAALGVLTLTSNPSVVFTHPRNMLTDIWQETKQSDTYPPAVWYVLMEPAFSNQGQSSLAHNARRRWQHYGQLERPDSRKGRAQQQLLFGGGGRYDADALRLRADMLNELQASVRLINQELRVLLQELTPPGQ
ncbi:hypothetical protein MUN82_11805 [Hymenobacter aerilatus]|uniref:Uncharacterized protein n=1 Tax=Hymenobacter aerilatus TaxID=2932251 RepID=A0A8T9SSB0_9BACT|nr:hypothetical protein [Hymenobacter aerilatus]UOR03633.1 hypothetical protein MUN82_11805 [Hymenobacter aerilatus]